MYKLSHERCLILWFLFPVMMMLALSGCCCAGFRIDNTRGARPLATMLRAPQEPPAAIDLMSSASSIGATSAAVTTSAMLKESTRTRWFRDVRQRHRIRHSHHQAQTRIDVYVRMPQAALVSSSTTPAPPPRVAVVAQRSQRSPAHNMHRQRHHQPPLGQVGHQNGGGPGGPGGGRRGKPCQEQDIGRKAYIANTVVLAKAESMSANRVRNYSVSFRILRRFKTPDDAVVDDNLRLTFMNDTRRMNCESELFGGDAGVVKAQIRQSKEYYLFLNSQFNHNYTLVGAPVLNYRKKRRQADVERTLLNVTGSNFEPRLKKPVVKVPSHPELRVKVRLICKARGFPIPVIKWKKNDSFLHSSNNIKITYQRRKSTVVIRSMEERDTGRYTCIARGVDGQETNDSYDLRIPNKEKCEDNELCLNGGTCKYNASLKEHYCICSEGYTGSRCMSKTVGVSDYPSSATYDDE